MKGVWLQILIIVIAGSSEVWADEFKRFEVQPFGGFTASGSIPLKAEGDGSHASIHVNSSHNIGATFSINLNELDAIEGHWQRQFTEGRLPAGIVDPQSSGSVTPFNLNIDQMHCNFLHHYRIADPRLMPYVMAGLGATTYYGSGSGQNKSKSYFSFALGGGLKYYFSRHFGIRGEARWSPAVLSASDSSFWCSIGGEGANCAIDLKTSLQHQLDLTGGVLFRF